MKAAGFYDLKQAFAEPGCALCRLLIDHADGYIQATLWELVNDIDGRVELNKARGYCNPHAWMLVRHGASLGAAILMDNIVLVAMREMEKAKFETQPGFSLRQMFGALGSAQPSGATAGLVEALGPQTHCPVCVAVDKSEDYFLTALINHLAAVDGLAEYYKKSDGLCLPHLRKALARVSNETTYNALIEAQMAVWTDLRAHLAEFIRKKDHRFTGEKIGEEGDSWLRGIEAVSGAQQVRRDKPVKSGKKSK